MIDADAMKKQWSMADKCEDCPQDARHCQFEQDFTRMDICEMIDEAPTVGGWISVKDRLPEYVGWYLVSLVNNRNGHRWKTPVVCEYSLDVWHEKDLFSNDVDATVTHWMPLPEPPEEVSGDAD